MKSHKVKHGGEFTVSGYNESRSTYCGITEPSENLILVGKHEECTCKTCNKAYQAEMKKLDKISYSMHYAYGL